MVFFSHWLDLVTKLISLSAMLVLMFSTGLATAIEGLIEPTPNPQFFGFISFAILVIIFYGAFHRPLVEVLSTQLYARLRFGVKVSWSEARLLKRLFSLNRQLQWQPMNYVRLLPREDRLKILMEAATR